MELIKSSKIVVKKSGIHGWGVFATEDILKSEIIEECPFFFCGVEWKDLPRELQRYTFAWPKGVNPSKPVVTHGYGAVFNHHDVPNVDWETDEKKNVITYKTILNVNKGGELFVSYGQDYWNLLGEKKVI